MDGGGVAGATRVASFPPGCGDCSLVLCLPTPIGSHFGLEGRRLRGLPMRKICSAANRRLRSRSSLASRVAAESCEVEPGEQLTLAHPLGGVFTADGDGRATGIASSGWWHAEASSWTGSVNTKGLEAATGPCGITCDELAADKVLFLGDSLWATAVSSMMAHKLSSMDGSRCCCNSLLVVVGMTLLVGASANQSCPR